MKTAIKKGLAFRRIAGELFIVDAAGARLHQLNGPAAVIWEGLAAGRSEAAIISAVTAEFETDEKTALSDYRAFARELEAAGLLSAGK
jgi:hypothetical protein